MWSLLTFVPLLYYSAVVKADFQNNDYELLDYEKSLTNVQIKNKTVALLVEDSPDNFLIVSYFVERMLIEKRFNSSDFWLVTFNSSGVSTVWAKSLNSTDYFYKQLDNLASRKKSQIDTTNNVSIPIFAIFNTAQILPKNGAIIIFTDSDVNIDAYLEKTALNVLLSKNIIVYTVNENYNVLNDSLQNIREYSGGKKLQLFQTSKDANYKHFIHSAPANVTVILVKKNLSQSNKLLIPIDYDITGIHITITPSNKTNGFLKSPREYEFSFTSKIKPRPVRYSQGSTFENNGSSIEIHLNFSTSGRPSTGMWTLTLENRDFYNVTVFAFSDIAAHAQIQLLNNGTYTNDLAKDMVKLGVTGRISHITDISLLDSNGETLLGNISYKFNKGQQKYVTETTDNESDNENKEVYVEIEKPSEKPVYALIRGKDVKGNTFQRLSYIFRKSDIFPIQSIVVEVAQGSELIVSPGKRAEVYFEVTNQGTAAQLVKFTCSDSKYILRSLSSYWRYLESQESTIVTLYLDPVYGTYRDEITFSVSSVSQAVQKKVVVDVGSNILDTAPPELTHRYTSDCVGILPADCNKGTWSVEITARDLETGLQRLNTIPKGIFFSYGYTAGTKESVTGYYSESCCNPDLQITAVDRLNNRISYSVNAYHARLSAAVIAVIVLAVILFVVAVVAIVIVVIKRTRNSESYDLPTYRGGGI